MNDKKTAMDARIVGKNVAQPRTHTPQSLVVVTHFLLAATYFSCLKERKRELSLSAPVIEPKPSRKAT